jgi:N-acetylglutamate synthase-like GNAT family acetyltransferase
LIEFEILAESSTETFNKIANWYFNEWKIPIETTFLQLEKITSSGSQFQVIMKLDGELIGTGGIYHHVSLMDRIPRFHSYKNWLALIYTLPNVRQNGYGKMLCDFIEKQAKQIEIDVLYLYTDTAENLYKRLGWETLERVNYAERIVIVMKKHLQSEDFN